MVQQRLRDGTITPPFEARRRQLAAAVAFRCAGLTEGEIWEICRERGSGRPGNVYGHPSPRLCPLRERLNQAEPPGRLTGIDDRRERLPSYVITVTGTSGAGKTTLVRAVARLLGAPPRFSSMNVRQLPLPRGLDRVMAAQHAWPGLIPMGVYDLRRNSPCGVAERPANTILIWRRRMGVEPTTRRGTTSVRV